MFFRGRIRWQVRLKQWKIYSSKTVSLQAGSMLLVQERGHQDGLEKREGRLMLFRAGEEGQHVDGPHAG